MKRRLNEELWKEAQITTMEEFEKILLREAQVASGVSQKMEQINQKTQEASRQLGDFLNKAQNLAEDDEAKDDDAEDDEDLEEEQKKARESLLDELNQLAIEAADNQEYKTAYKIERAYESIFFDGE